MNSPNEERSMTTYTRPTTTRDLREAGRVILAHGEATGHHHEVVDAEGLAAITIPAADFFEEPSGRRVLLVNRPCCLRHEEHDPIALDPANPQQVRQGDVLLQPIGDGAWEVRRQREYSPEAVRNVAD
jgi:hypothetical protein